MNMATKIPGKEYKCKHCDQFFNLLSAYKKHERTAHTAVKPYTCKHCKKCFSHSTLREQHERTHTEDKPFTCKYCKKCFRQSSTCTEHERIHTGEKPYSCKYCNKCFTQPSHCQSHVFSKHKQHNQYLNLNEEPSTAQGSDKSRMLFSSTEEISCEVETLTTCWICQEECGSKERLIKHYDNHMR